MDHLHFMFLIEQDNKTTDLSFEEWCMELKETFEEGTDDRKRYLYNEARLAGYKGNMVEYEESQGLSP